MVSSLKTHLDELLDLSTSDGSFPGAVALVSKHDNVEYKGVFGKSSIVPEEREMREDSIFDLASLTKVVATTPAVLQLLESGRLSLSDTVSGFFSDVDWGSGNSKATVEDLLCHSSGFYGYYPFHRHAGDGVAVIRIIASMPPLYEPGKGEIYSDLDFILLGRIVEKVSGRPLDVYCRDNVFTPLGMHDTFFNPPSSLSARFVTTEVYPERTGFGTVHDENAHSMGGVSGHAGLFSTAADLMKYCSAVLNRGEFRGARILSARVADEMVRQRRPAIGGTYGLGWQLHTGTYVGPFGDLFPVWSFGHTGFTGTMLWMDRKSGVSSILLTNRVHPTRNNHAILRCRRLFNNIVAASLIDS